MQARHRGALCGLAGRGRARRGLWPAGSRQRRRALQDHVGDARGGEGARALGGDRTVPAIRNYVAPGPRNFSGRLTPKIGPNQVEMNCATDAPIWDIFEQTLHLWPGMGQIQPETDHTSPGLPRIPRALRFQIILRTLGLGARPRSLIILRILGWGARILRMLRVFFDLLEF